MIDRDHSGSVRPSRPVPKVSDQRSLASWALPKNITGRAFGRPLGLEDRLLRAAVTGGTKPMRRLGAAIVWLGHISDRSASNGRKLVIFALAAPLLIAHHLLFKFVYACQIRRLALLSRKQRALGINDFGEQIDLDLIRDHRSPGCIPALNDSLKCVETAKARTDLRNSYHPDSPSGAGSCAAQAESIV